MFQRSSFEVVTVLGLAPQGVTPWRRLREGEAGRRAGWTLALAAALVLASGAWAQPGTAGAAAPMGRGQAVERGGEAPGRSVPVLEEVLVTAQRRVEDLQETALAISVVGGAALRREQAVNLFDVMSKSPNLVVAPFSMGQPEIAIRGIGTKEDGVAANDSTVISIDDVYVAARSAQIFDLFDLERVEVLRGPQGTLYGKNSIAGSINLVTSKPADELAARFRVTVGEYGRLDLGGMVTGPLGEGLAGKVALSRRVTDGYVDYIPTGKEVGETENLSLRGQLLIQPGPDWALLLSADVVSDDNGHTNREPVGSGPGAPPASDSAADTYNNPVAINLALGRWYGEDATDPHNSLSDDISVFERDIAGLSAKFTWQASPVFELTSITAWRRSEMFWLEDSAGLPTEPQCSGAGRETDPPGPCAGVGLPKPQPDAAEIPIGFRRDTSNSADEEATQFTQELRLSSAGDAGLQWLAGLFFSVEEIERVEHYIFGNSQEQRGATNYLGKAVTPAPTNVSDQANESTSWALYGQAAYALADGRANLVAGLRYSSEEKDWTTSAQAYLDAFGSAAGTVAALPFLNTIEDLNNWPSIAVATTNYDAVTTSDSWTNVSGKLALDYRFQDGVFGYASISTGFKSGGFSGGARTPERARRSFEPEEAINYEVGLKSDLLNGRLRINTAAFFTDYQDLQVTRFYRPVGLDFGEFITENAAEASISGVEVEFAGALGYGFEIGGGLAWLDATYDDFQPDTPNATCPVGPSRELGSNLGCIPDFSGNRLRQAPETSGTLYLDYLRVTRLGDIGIHLNYRFQGDSYYDPDNNAITVIPSYRVFDFYATWTPASQNWEFDFWIKNLADEEYRTHVYSQRGGSIAFAAFGPPRWLGLALTRKF